MAKVILRALVLVALLLVPSSALGAGRLQVPRGAPIELRPSAGTYEGAFDVRNVGDEPLSSFRASHPART